MVTALGLTKFAQTQKDSKIKKKISSWAKESVNVVVRNEYNERYGRWKVLSKKDTYTKEQAVSTMIRLINNVPDSGSREKSTTRDIMFTINILCG